MASLMEKVQFEAVLHVDKPNMGHIVGDFCSGRCINSSVLFLGPACRQRFSTEARGSWESLTLWEVRARLSLLSNGSAGL